MGIDREFINMKFAKVGFALAFAFAAVTSVSAEIEVEEGVFVLGDDTFDSFVKEHEYVLAEFYAPWCGHCKNLAPEYAKAAQTLAENESGIKLAKIDATVHKELGSKYEVQGYPTLKFFRSGEPSEYQGGRSAADIVSWLTKKTGPAATTLEDVATLTAKKEAENVMVVGVFDDLEGDAAKEYLEVAKKVDSPNFYISKEAAVRAELAVEGDKIVLLKQFDEGRNDFEGDIATELLDFIEANELPLVIPFNPETQPKIFGGSITDHVLLFADDEGLKQFGDCYATAAKEFRGKAYFVHVDTADESNARVAQFFGITAEDGVQLRVIKVGENLAKYAPEEAITCDAIIPFVTKYFAGELEPALNSEEIPEDWDKEPVKVLVGKNFKEVALNKDKHVFVEFYAPWCGHCKSLAPTWDELATKFESNDKIVIAKMDSTANEVAAVQIQGFPTLKFFPAGSDEIIDYNGGRTLDALVEFVNKYTEGSAAAEEEHDEL